MTTLRGIVAEDLSAEHSDAASHSGAVYPSSVLAPRLGRDDPPDSDDGDNGSDSDAGISVKTRAKTKKPSLYKVLMLNDDYTPMEFVVYVLQRFFGMDHSRAVDIMLTVHNKGVAVVGVYPYEVAETKVMQVMDCARSNQHPLQCTLEKE